MKNRFPSLITTDAQAGLTLADQLAAELHAQVARAHSGTDHPGGTNYLLPAAVPQEITAAILFYAIAAANQGWAGAAYGQAMVALGVPSLAKP